jgi:hypothetical protein
MYHSALDQTVSEAINLQPNTNQFNIGYLSEGDPFFQNEYFGVKQSIELTSGPALHSEYTRVNAMLCNIGIPELEDIFVSNNESVANILKV